MLSRRVTASAYAQLQCMALAPSQKGNAGEADRHSFEKWSDQCRCFCAVWRILVRIHGYCTTSHPRFIPVHYSKDNSNDGPKMQGALRLTGFSLVLPPSLRNRTSSFLLFLILSSRCDNVFHLLLLRLPTSFSNVSDSAAKSSMTDRINRSTPELPAHFVLLKLGGVLFMCICFSTSVWAPALAPPRVTR